MNADPKIVYHYTTQEGLLGIIENEKLFATNIKFLNDTKEFDFGINQLALTLKELRLENNRSRYDALIEKITYEMLCHINTTQHNSFITSFSEQKDLLSQWRAYAPTSTGYCIGFRFNELFYPRSPKCCIVSKVKYEDESKKNGARSLINELKEMYRETLHKLIPSLTSNNKEEVNKWVDELEKFDKENSDFITLDLKEYGDKEQEFSWYNKINEAKLVVLSRIKSFVETHKHNSFLEENEWRFITGRIEATSKKEPTIEQIEKLKPA